MIYYMEVAAMRPEEYKEREEAGDYIETERIPVDIEGDPEIACAFWAKEWEYTFICCYPCNSRKPQFDLTETAWFERC